MKLQLVYRTPNSLVIAVCIATLLGFFWTPIFVTGISVILALLGREMWIRPADRGTKIMLGFMWSWLALQVYGGAIVLLAQAV